MMTNRLAFLFCFQLLAFSQSPPSEKTYAQNYHPIKVISDGDFIHPTLSPDGRYLAVSRVIVTKLKNGFLKLTDIRIYDLPGGTYRTFLTTAQSKKFASYSAFVIAIRWKSNNRFIADISDGDVDSTEVTFNVVRGKVSEKANRNAADKNDLENKAEEESRRRLSEAAQERRSKAQEMFSPTYAKDILEVTTTKDWETVAILARKDTFSARTVTVLKRSASFDHTTPEKLIN